MKKLVNLVSILILIGITSITHAQSTTDQFIADNKIQTLIERLKLQPHVEGGFFKETYKSKLSTLTPWEKTRPLNTAIYYLLRSQDFSQWHQLKSDEIWHFYTGTSATIYDIDQNGQLHTIILGDPTMDKSAIPQVVVPKNTWFAVKVNKANSFILVGCTMSPGFDYHDFKVGDRQMLLAQYPQYKTLIKQFTVV